MNKKIMLAIYYVILVMVYLYMRFYIIDNEWDYKLGFAIGLGIGQATIFVINAFKENK